MGENESEFERHKRAFREQLPDLIGQGKEGKWAFGRAGDTFECWDTYEDALTRAYKMYGTEQRFFVHKVKSIELYCWEFPELINTALAA